MPSVPVAMIGMRFSVITTRDIRAENVRTYTGFSSKSWTDAVRRGAIVARPTALPLSELLVANRHRGRHNIKARLIAEGLKQMKCAQCDISAWHDKPLSLALHHINGDGHDNRLENLALLCPNCHSQTPNFGVKNVARKAA
jgi:5-methylcytosine-specific restriction endonuclease McrA